MLLACAGNAGRELEAPARCPFHYVERSDGVVFNACHLSVTMFVVLATATATATVLLFPAALILYASAVLSGLP